VPDGGAVTDLIDSDPDLWLIRDQVFDAEGEETHMFWEAASVVSNLLPPAVTLDITDERFDHSVLHSYPLGATPVPERIELVVHLQGMGRDVLDDLIASGDLDPSFRDSIRTFQPESGTMTWTTETAGADRCTP